MRPSTLKKSAPKHDRVISFSWQFKTILGVNKSERTHHQNIEIKLEIKLDDTRLYDHPLDKNIEHIIGNYLAHKKPYLLERMAYDLARAILAVYSETSSLSLTIEKPEALAQARNAHVTIRYGSLL